MKQLLLDLLPPAAPDFDNLVSGANAELISAARQMVAGSFADRILYVWGEQGAGKSHLCEAVLKASSHAERWDRVALHSMPSVDHLYVLDGVDGLDLTGQASLFNFLNEMAESSILIVGQQPTRDLALRRDLTTRIGSGLTFQMKLLSDDQKQAALMAHAQARGMTLGAGVAAYLLRHGRRDMRSLVAILDAIDNFSLETGRAVTLPMVREALNGA